MLDIRKERKSGKHLVAVKCFLWDNQKIWVEWMVILFLWSIVKNYHLLFVKLVWIHVSEIIIRGYAKYFFIFAPLFIRK